MGEVVDMAGRVVVADQHPLGAESVEHVSVKDRELLRVAWDEAPEVARYFADRHDFDYDDAVICLVHSLLREAQRLLREVLRRISYWSSLAGPSMGLAMATAIRQRAVKTL